MVKEVYCSEDIDKLTESEALEWLIENDEEGREDWEEMALDKHDTDFKGAVRDICEGFGYDDNPIEERPPLTPLSAAYFAAPDLLAALQGILDYVHSPIAKREGNLDTLCMAAKAAIAKAGGKQAPQSPIIIVMEGGVIQDIDSIPAGLKVEVRYFGEPDIEERPEAVTIDGELCAVDIWG